MMWQTNTVTILDKLNTWNLLKICLQVICKPYILLHNLHSFLPPQFYYGKSENIWFLKTNCYNKTFYAWVGNRDKWFCTKSWEMFANSLLLLKVPSKKRLSERCWTHSKPLEFTVCMEVSRFSQDLHVKNPILFRTKINFKCRPSVFVKANTCVLIMFTSNIFINTIVHGSITDWLTGSLFAMMTKWLNGIQSLLTGFRITF